MFQPHSILWHALWVGPNLLLLSLGIFLFVKHRRSYPAFIAFAILSSIGQLVLYSVDVIPSFTPETFWTVNWFTLGLESILKFIVIAEIFSRLLENYSSIAKLGRVLIRGVGVLITLAAALAAAYTPKDGNFSIVSGVHILEQTSYLIECGLLVFIFAFASYFHLAWDRFSFGIAVGLSLSACVHLAVKAAVANAGLNPTVRNALDFLNMGTYQAAVLVWFYYLLVPARSAQPVSASTDILQSENQPLQIFPLPAANDHAEVLSKWNRELERLLHQ
jgi:hypothetical protein